MDALCIAHNINVHYQPMGREDAFLFTSEDNPSVDFLINSTMQVVRQRFSIAHELGHFFLHRGKNLICHSTEINATAFLDQRPNPERSADEFAANIVIPFMLRPLLRPIQNITFKCIQETAKRFRASIPATVLQIANLGEHSIMIAVYNEDGNLRFSRKSSLLREKLCAKILSSDMHAFDVLRSQNSKSGMVPADEWFEGVDNEIDVFEESTYWHGQVISIISVEDGRLLAD